MKFTIILNLTAAFAMLATTTSSVYASDSGDHAAVQSAPLRGSRDISADEDSSTNEKLWTHVNWDRVHQKVQEHKEARQRHGVGPRNGGCCILEGGR